MQTKELKQYCKFLESAGAEMLKPTSQWEVVRFRANGRTGIVYRNKNEALTFFDEAEKAWDAFKNRTPWEAIKQQKTTRKSASSVLKRSLLDRDGSGCFYCGKDMQPGTETIEHLLSLKHGGKHHIDNMALTPKECNLLAGSVSVVEKVKLRERIRSAKGS